MIPLSRASAVGNELRYVAEVIQAAKLSGNGPFTQECQNRLLREVGGRAALLTNSCTAALEMSAILADLASGDEVIMPSYTHVSTANAFALRGAVPVFVDIRPDTLNIDETQIEAAITNRTKAIVPVHYAGVVAEMDTINALATRHDLAVIEDAALALFATYRGQSAGTLGQLACFSFHETKNIVSGEGGALIVSDTRFETRAQIIWEMGTNRKQLCQGLADNYTWIDIGSSFLPGELVSAFLLAQLEKARAITEKRLALWARYDAAFADLEAEGRVRRPIVPEWCQHNGHIFYLLLENVSQRDAFITHMKASGVLAPFHYVPLHTSPAGQRFTRTAGSLPVTEDVSWRLVRLPLYFDLGADQDYVIDTAIAFFS